MSSPKGFWWPRPLPFTRSSFSLSLLSSPSSPWSWWWLQRWDPDRLYPCVAWRLARPIHYGLWVTDCKSHPENRYVPPERYLPTPENIFGYLKYIYLKIYLDPWKIYMHLWDSSKSSLVLEVLQKDLKWVLKRQNQMPEISWKLLKEFFWDKFFIWGLEWPTEK